MKFCDRKEELKLLSQINKLSEKSSQMTVLVGRRRVGKTRLVLKSIERQDYLYFFIAKKEEKLLCEEFVEEIKIKLKTDVFGEITTFKDLFALLIEISKTKHFTLIIDEFQEFYNVNSSVYSDMQNIWDKNKDAAKMNLILCGSIYSLMKKIFENSKEPLFGRANERIYLKPFNIETLKNILEDNVGNYTKKDLLAFYILTGGLAKYVEMFTDKRKFKLDTMLNEIFRENSYFIEEGKNVLIEEFGKEYTTYFSILSLIASSKTSRPEIESVLQKDIGGYLNKLENEYGIIKKKKPVFSKEGSRTVKFIINDNFLNFWFRFIYKYRSAIEIGNFEYVKNIVKRDFNTYSGLFLEKYFTEKLSLTKKYSLIGSYWEKGNKNEIDIIAVNREQKSVIIAEVKLNKSKISTAVLKEKSEKIHKHLLNYKITYKGFSVDDM